jgi:hypothetical protein
MNATIRATFRQAIVFPPSIRFCVAGQILPGWPYGKVTVC